MMETRRRLVLWLMMLLATVVLFTKGRVTSDKEVSAAFLHYGPAKAIVLFEGNIVKPGVYEFPRGLDLMTVMKMTVPEWKPVRTDRMLLNRVIRGGDVVRLSGDGRQHIEITLKKMPAREMMILGIPLDPNRMEVDDWDSLPGIGPVLAMRIVNDRHKNGAFASPTDLERVPGIGKQKLNQLIKYF